MKFLILMTLIWFSEAITLKDIVSYICQRDPQSGVCSSYRSAINNSSKEVIGLNVVLANKPNVTKNSEAQNVRLDEVNKVQKRILRNNNFAIRKRDYVVPKNNTVEKDVFGLFDLSTNSTKMEKTETIDEETSPNPQQDPFKELVNNSDGSSSEKESKRNPLVTSPKSDHSSPEEVEKVKEVVKEHEEEKEDAQNAPKSVQDPQIVYNKNKSRNIDEDRKAYCSTYKSNYTRLCLDDINSFPEEIRKEVKLFCASYRVNCIPNYGIDCTPECDERFHPHCTIECKCDYLYPLIVKFCRPLHVPSMEDTCNSWFSLCSRRYIFEEAKED